jgi:diguanylate cyclase (GGDEF)-like protein/PAS domain S-box-containing protein
MIESRVLGLFLRIDEERELLHAAALRCGLQPVDLTGLAPIPVFAPPLDAKAAEWSNLSNGHLPQLIVTDELAGPWSLDPGSSFSQYDAPMLLLIRDKQYSSNSASIFTDAIEPVTILDRPLRLEIVIAALRQAASFMTAFNHRHQIMFEDLHHCRRVFNSVSNGITISDANVPGFPLTYVNPAFERMTGYSAGEVCGRNCNFLQGTDTDQPAVAAIRKALNETTDLRVVLRNYRKDGTLFWNELYLSPICDLSGKLTHFVGIQNDVTLQIEATQQLQHLAHHDALTGLANRALLMTQLEQSLQRAQRIGGTVAVLYFDLDNFKLVNDTFGHDAGDRLLLVIANRLRSLARSGETVARLGGDEFVVVLEHISADRQPAEVMQRLIAHLGESTNVVGTGFHPSASVGMSLYPQDGHNAKEMLKSADFNMYIAKHGIHAEEQLAETQAADEPLQTPTAVPSPARRARRSRA